MILITTGSYQAKIRFAYDPEVVALVKAVPDRSWHPDGKYWTIDVDLVRALAASLYKAGRQVFIDGELFELKQAAVAPEGIGNILIALFDEVPDDLRVGTFRALARAWHPDVGGDTVLMQQLNLAVESTK